MAQKKIHIIFLLIMILNAKLAHQNITSYRKQLADKLLTGYDKQVKPEGQVNISIQVFLMQIVNVVEKDQVITFNTWITQFWYDARLTWDPSAFNGLNFTALPSDKFWAPDTMILSSADTDVYLRPEASILNSLYPDGQTVFSKMMNNLKSRCQMEIIWFPYDQQTCTIVLASTIYANESINYVDKGDDTLRPFNFVEHKVWQLVSYSYQVVNTVYPGYDGTYSEMHLKITIRRKPLFVISNLIVPALCLSVITLISFYIPFAQAMPIGISIVLAYSVLAIRLNDNLPTQSDSLPVLSSYFIICMVFTIMGMIWFATLNKIKEKKLLPVPVKYFIVYCLTLCLCKPKTRKRILSSVKNNSVDGSDNGASVDKLTQDQLFLQLIAILNRFLFAVFLVFLSIINFLILVIFPQSSKS